MGEMAFDHRRPAMDRDEHAPSIRDSSRQAEDPALQRELRRELTAALDALPGDFRAIVMLRDVEGLSPSTISQITGLSVAAVKTRTHRARLMLRKRLEEYFAISVKRSALSGPLR